VTTAPEQRLAAALAGGRELLALAESCTGGLIAHRITEIPGSSAYLERGLVVYSNHAKQELLGVDPSLLAREGAVSEACATAMLRGLFERTPADLGAAVTGIAGPTGSATEKPVGTVWIAWGRREASQVECRRFSGSRSAIKWATATAVLERLVTLVETR
jgi:nicotinamide-nucleotide amidase